MTDYERIKSEFDLSLLQKDRFMSLVYPVGSIYMSINDISPASLFGGVWERIEGVFLLAASDGHPAGETDGAETHTLTVDQMPKHKHNFGLSEGRVLPGLYLMNDTAGGDNTGLSWHPYRGEDSWIGMHDTGGNQPHNNMPPYLSVYMWVRIK